MKTRTVISNHAPLEQVLRYVHNWCLAYLEDRGVDYIEHPLTLVAQEVYLAAALQGLSNATTIRATLSNFNETFSDFEKRAESSGMNIYAYPYLALNQDSELISDEGVVLIITSNPDALVHQLFKCKAAIFGRMTSEERICYKVLES